MGCWVVMNSIHFCLIVVVVVNSVVAIILVLVMVMRVVVFVVVRWRMCLTMLITIAGHDYFLIFFY